MNVPVGNPELREALSLFQQATEHFEAGDFEGARSRFQRSQALNRQQNNEEAVAIIDMYLGQIHAEIGEMEAAEAAFQAAHDGMAALHDRAGQGQALLELGELAFWNGDRERSEKLLRQVLALLGDELDADARAQAHVRLGYMRYDAGEHAEAREHYERALTLFDQTGDRAGAASTMIELANTLQIDDPHRALRLFERGRDLAQTVGNDYLASVALHGMGILYADRGEWPAARRYLQTALDLKNRVEDFEGQAFTYLSLGDAEQALGNFAGATQAWKRAMALAEKHGLPSVAEVAENHLAEGEAS